MRDRPIAMEDLLKLPSIRGRLAHAIISAQPWTDEDAHAIRGVGRKLVKYLVEAGLVDPVYGPVYQTQCEPRPPRQVDVALVRSFDAAIVALQRRARRTHQAIEQLRAMRDEEAMVRPTPTIAPPDRDG